LLGPWLGAMYVILLPSFFSLIGEPNFYALLGGVVLIVFTIALPGGIVSVVRRGKLNEVVRSITRGPFLARRKEAE